MPKPTTTTSYGAASAGSAEAGRTSGMVKPAGSPLELMRANLEQVPVPRERGPTRRERAGRETAVGPRRRTDRLRPRAPTLAEVTCVVRCPSARHVRAG